MNRYEICRQFSEGFCAAILPAGRDTAKSEHWLAGWDAGYEYRKCRNEALDKYLISTGREPQAIVRPCSPNP